MYTYIDIHTHQPTAEGIITPRSFGIHPWDADSSTLNDRQPFMEADIIGECGLDKVCKSDWQRQMELFEAQLRLAEELKKPVVVHCVRAFNEIVLLRKRFHATPWIVHGFTGSIPQEEDLIRHGIRVSFGASLIDPRREKVRATFRHLLEYHPEALFLETDDSKAGIVSVYRAASEVGEKEELFICETIKKNYSALWQI